MLSTNSRAPRPNSGRKARTQSPHGLTPRALLAGGLAFALIACAPATVNPNGGGSGGKSGSGGSSSGGSGSGGSGSGGSNSGGNAQGGSGSGGSNNGGSNNGGSNSGGSAKGGSASGGTANGGSASGGSNNGGSNNGGSNSGGSNSGGSSGSASGGSGSGGSGSGGSSSTGNPPGYWMTKDWNVTSVDWHGCVWTGIDSTVASSTTTITPQDFTAAATEGGPYEVSGTVFNDYNAVAMIGFSLNEATNGKSDQCKYNKAASTAAGPPVATMPSSATGIAVNWSAKVAPVTAFRIQIQGVNGATDPTNRWCATITDAQGPSFVPFTSFSTQCWTGATNPVAYKNEPIDAVVFLVPGTITAKAPFDFTIVGFAPGTSVAQAPGKAAACGTTTGTVGSNSQLSGQAAIDASAQRAAITGTDCKKYIINNNNWGNQSGSYQYLTYTGNSFTDVVTSGSGGGANVVSFPSIYIGANGQIGGGTFNTWSDSGLPKQISAMKSAQSTFKWSGGNSGGNFNATYDIWFAKSPPTAGGYNDGVSGLLMIWLYKPSQSQPIGSSGNTRSATIGGQQFDVWRGNRNATATGTDGTGRPVISYVAKSTITNFSADLKAFFDDAVTNGAADMAAGSGITQAFSSSWYLTDVFAGFEIWAGGDAKGLQDTFTCVIQ
jgi:hypothetical protein